MAERLRAALFLVALLLPPPLASAAPRIAVIIDDLGKRADVQASLDRLPARVALAFLPHRPHSADLAARAVVRGHEVLVHLPMAAQGGERLGPGGLDADLEHGPFLAVLREALASVPGAVGVNNHMGSALTREGRQMGWLMVALAETGLFFVDSRTTHETVAHRAALAAGVPATERDVFLDNAIDAGAIGQAFDELVARALRDGSALAIAHPHRATLEVLIERLPGLAAAGIELVGVGELITRRAATGFRRRAAPALVSGR